MTDNTSNYDGNQVANDSTNMPPTNPAATPPVLPQFPSPGVSMDPQFGYGQPNYTQPYYGQTNYTQPYYGQPVGSPEFPPPGVNMDPRSGYGQPNYTHPVEGTPIPADTGVVENAHPVAGSKPVEEVHPVVDNQPAGENLTSPAITESDQPVQEQIPEESEAENAAAEMIEEDTPIEEEYLPQQMQDSEEKEETPAAPESPESPVSLDSPAEDSDKQPSESDIDSNEVNIGADEALLSETKVIPVYSGEPQVEVQSYRQMPAETERKSLIEDMMVPVPEDSNQAYQHSVFGEQLPENYTPPPVIPDPMAVPYAAPVKKKMRKRNKVLLVVLCVLLVLVLAGGIAGYQYLMTTHGSQQEAEKFLKAIVDGDATAASKIYSPPGNPEDNVLLRNDIYEKAKLRPSGYEITSSQEEDKEANIKANLVINSKNYPLHIQMKDISKNGFVPNWQVSKADFGHIELVSMPKKLVINGVKVDMGKVLAAHKDTKNIKLPVFPGQYEIKAESGNKYLTYGEAETLQSLPESRESDYQEKNKIEFKLAMTNALRDEITSQVRNRLAKCLPSREFTPDGCEHLNLENPSYAVTAITRSWVNQPSIKVSDTLMKTADDKYQGSATISGGRLHIDYKWRFDEEDDWEDDHTEKYEVFSYGYQLHFSINKDKLEIDWDGF